MSDLHPLARAVNHPSPARGNLPRWRVILIALAITVAGLLIAFANFRETRAEKSGGHQKLQEIGEGRTRFLAYCGLCASGIFGLAVTIQLTSILTLSTCLGTASFT
jgi:hypothetical protein